VHARTPALLLSSLCAFAWPVAAVISVPTKPVVERPPPFAPELEPTTVCLPSIFDGDDDDVEGEGHDDNEADDAEDAPGADPESEQHDVPQGNALVDGRRYTSDLSDEELRTLWTSTQATLGSVSVGFTDSGRIVNAVPFPTDGNWLVVDPQHAWATQETVDFVVAAIREVEQRMPGSPPLRINDISSKDGGWLRPHRSHQNGRDVDLGFYYPTADPVRIRARESCIDVARNWALVRALITNGDVQVILVDRRVQSVLKKYALSIGEDSAWLDSIFDGATGIVKHARRHRDHFHVRYYNARAQELGRRVQPLLAQRPEHNRLTIRIKRGDTLGGIAHRYGVSLTTLKRENGLRSNMVRAGRRLVVPLRGPCTQCPVPPVVVVPPRRVPPADAAVVVESPEPVGSVQVDVVLSTSAATSTHTPDATATQ
jgi:LysM repeat protein/murein endopeptidase